MTFVPPESNDEKLDLIVTYLHRLDKRDKLRTIGGFVTRLFMALPVLILLLSVWYLYHYGDELMAEFTQKSAEAVHAQFNESTSGISDTIKSLLPQ